MIIFDTRRAVHTCSEFVKLFQRNLQKLLSAKIQTLENLALYGTDLVGAGPPVSVVPTVVLQPFSFSLVLDIQGNGLVVVRSDTIITNIMVTCSEGEVFHPPSGECRPTICPEGFTQTGGTCNFVPTATDRNCSGQLRTLNELE